MVFRPKKGLPGPVGNPSGIRRESVGNPSGIVVSWCLEFFADTRMEPSLVKVVSYTFALFFSQKCCSKSDQKYGKRPLSKVFKIFLVSKFRSIFFKCRDCLSSVNFACHLLMLLVFF